MNTDVSDIRLLTRNALRQLRPVKRFTPATACQFTNTSLTRAKINSVIRKIAIKL